MEPINTVINSALSKQSPRGFGPKARHELLQKLREKGYLSEEEYTRHTEPIQSVDNGDSVVQAQGLKHPQLDEQPLDKFERFEVLHELRKKGYLSDQEYAHYMWPGNENQETRESWLKRQKLYAVQLEELELNVREFKSFIKIGVTTIGDLLDIVEQIIGFVDPPLYTMPKGIEDLLRKLKDKGYVTEEYVRSQEERVFYQRQELDKYFMARRNPPPGTESPR
ncbi:MAG TPA: hypothetical protein PLQ56_18385 [Aggregatilineales bacterium]|nr:hypothetical protein [Aggregatilineales bacterium]